MGWVKPAIANGWGFWQTHDESNVNWNDWISMFAYSSGTFYFRMGNGSFCCANDVTFSNSEIAVNQWSHIAFTWEGTTMRAYVNGVEKGSRTTATFQSVLDPKARIGYGHSASMNGRIDEIIILNRAVSAEDITKIYNYQKR